jgi:hypothetical protein
MSQKRGYTKRHDKEISRTSPSAAIGGFRNATYRSGLQANAFDARQLQVPANAVHDRSNVNMKTESQV